MRGCAYAGLSRAVGKPWNEIPMIDDLLEEDAMRDLSKDGIDLSIIDNARQMLARLEKFG